MDRHNGHSVVMMTIMNYHFFAFTNSHPHQKKEKERKNNLKKLEWIKNLSKIKKKKKKYTAQRFANMKRITFGMWNCKMFLKKLKIEQSKNKKKTNNVLFFTILSHTNYYSKT